MIIRISTIIWMILLVVGVFGLYMVKYKVREVKAEVAATERQLAEEKRNQHVLDAEWTYLNRPERLKSLSAKYLDVKPMRGQQLADFVSLPYTNGNTPDASGKQQGPQSNGAIKLVSGGGSAGGETQYNDDE